MLSTDTKFEVKTSVFEGPMEVLLRLVEERKLFINEISLAKVTDDYIAYVKALEGNSDIDEITGFIAIAATLILIKSKSLLPTLNLTKDEEGQIDDLEKRLRLYQIYKNASILISNNFGKNIIFQREESKNDRVVFTPDNLITIENMFSSIHDVISNIPKKEFLPEVTVKKVVSIEEMIGSLIERVEKNIRTSFREFSKSSSADQKEQKVYVIVSFLAMLELVRQGMLNVIQDNNFQDIEMESVTKQADLNETINQEGENDINI